MNLQIRRATPDEAEALTTLAHAAKRHWGYPEEWIEQWKTDLTITPDFVANNEVFVATIDGEIAGCCALVSSIPFGSFMLYRDARDDFGGFDATVFVLWEFILVAIIVTVFCLYSRKKT